MTDTAEAISGGTAELDAGSQLPQPNDDETTGAEGAGTAQEPTVEIDGKQVPLSVAKRALKNDERFTQESQRIADERRAVEEEKARIEQASISTRGLEGVASALTNPEIRQRVEEAVPELAASLPPQQQIVDSGLLAENIKLKFDLFSREHPEFGEDQLAGIRAETFRLAKQGQVDSALDFESIGFRLYKDTIIEAEANRIAAAREKERKAKEQASRQAGTIPAGMPAIPGNVDISKLPPAAKLSLGHRQRVK